MQKETIISDWMSISKFFLRARRNFEIKFLMIVTFGLFSNYASAQPGLPLENFNSGIPGTWAITSNQTVTSNWQPTTATGGYLGTPGAVVDPAANNTVGTTAEYYLITPQFVTPNATEIRFYTKQGSFGNRGTTFKVLLSNADQPDIASFNVPLATWTETTLNTNPTAYEEKIVTVPSIPAGRNVYIAFVAITQQTGTTGTAGDTWFVDNIRVIESCSKVAGINASMSANGGVINWTHPFATNFEIQVVPQGQGAAATGTPVNGFTYNATGLADGTDYDVYIKTICDATTASAWAGPFPVKTARLGLSCATPIVIPNTINTTPYVLSTNLATFHDPQNYTPMTSIGLSCQPPSSNQNWLMGDHAILSYTPTTSGLVNISQTVTSGAPCYNTLSSVFIFDSCTGIGSTANCLGSIVTGSPSSVLSAQLNNIYLQAGQTYYFVISSPYQYYPDREGASICFTFTISAPTCPVPSGLAAENLLHNSATVSWANPQNLVSAWEYLVKPVSAGPPTGADTVTPSTTNTNINVSGLTPDTNYNLFVRSVCSGTPGGWSNAFPFRTQCTTFTPPYSTQFTNSTNAEPQCWSALDLNRDGTTFSYAGAPDSPPVQGNLVRLRTVDSGNQTNDMIISPRITLDGVTQKQIRFKFKGFGGYTNNTGYVLGESSYKIVASTTGIGPNNFTTEILPIATYQTGNNYIEKIVVVPASLVGDVNFAWYLPPGFVNTATNFYLDDVYIEDLPACSPPSYPGVTAGSITQTQAQFFWTNGYNTSQWQVAVQPLGSGVPTGSGEMVGTNPFLKTGLNPSTRYEYYVRSYCNATEQSAWVGPVPFNTLCDAQPVPYFESLNTSDVNTKKFCWSVINRNGDNNSVWTIEDTQASIVGRNLPFNPFVSFDDYLVSAPVNAVGRKMLKYKYKVAANIFNPIVRGNFEVIMSPSPDFTTYTVLIPAHDFNNLDFLENSVVFTGTGPTYFAFHLPANMTDPTNTGLMQIDDFSIEDAPLCPNPSFPVVSNIGTNSATLSWTPGFNETQWEVAIQSPNSGIPTGSGTVVNTNPTYNATGLTQNTEYEYYVRAVCGSDFSAWIGPIRFKTICNVLPSPFIETFEPDSQTESCWAIVNSNGDANDWNMNMPVEPMFGAQMATLNCYTNGDSNDWLISPTITVQPNQRLRFYYKSTYEPYIGNDLMVKLSTGGADISQFTRTLFDTAVSGLITNTDTREMVINLTDITAPTNINIAFHVPPGEPGPEGLRGTFVDIDNVIIESIPVCPSVINVVADQNTLTDTQVSVNWQEVGSAASWELSVQPFGTPAPIGDTQDQYLHRTNAHPYLITGLLPSSRYQYYVRAVCSSSSKSEWVGPFDILTKCDLTNVCEYTITLRNGSTGQVQRSINVVQNGEVYQRLTFPVVAPNQPLENVYTVFLCRGIEFNLFWEGSGSGLQYSQATVEIRDNSGAIVFTTPPGLGTINTNIFTGISNCSAVTCPQPTNIAVSNTGTLSWTPGGTETQWEVSVQPLGNGVIPQSGIIVNTPSYTPVPGDFLYPLAGTNEFFVRAVCGSTDKSYWTGPYVFIKNDEPSTAIVLPVNTGGACTTVGTNASFLGATPSSVPSSCEGVNGGDIWYEFVATSKIQTVELSNFNPGSYYSSSFQGAWPLVVMSLYEVQTDGSLVEKLCSNNNSLVAIYSSELIVGNTYKVRVKLNDTGFVDKKFDICVSVPAETCDMDAFNYSFEKLPMQSVTGITTIINARVVPGWRVNTDFGVMFFQEAANSPGVIPYEGAQCIQLVQDATNTWDPASPVIKGLYKDFDTSQMSEMEYSFASASRLAGTGSTVELWAGPPSGPFTMVTEHNSNTLVWSLRTGTYTVPVGQATTRFIFRTKGYQGGHLLDAANFKEKTNIVTSPAVTLTCDQTSTIVEGSGIGQWTADPNNPAATTITQTPNTGLATISGFNSDTPGVYTYYWETHYCKKPMTVTLEMFTDVATVTSPVEYCQTQTATALTATAPQGYTLIWYTEPEGGTGDTNAPVPSTATVGSTTYYVALVNSAGCIGERTPIVVNVNPLVPAVVGFNYDNATYCTDATAPVITTDSGFTAGGTFTATPAGLAINAQTGAINLTASAEGVYTVTYSVGALVQGCNDAGVSAPQTVTITGPCGYIPRGISPNGDGMNDEFDLSQFEVKKVIIFNRYGMEVYSHGEGYEKQWTGLSNDGEKLPDGTYFYNIVKGDNTTVTGWVYINRQY